MLKRILVSAALLVVFTTGAPTVAFAMTPVNVYRFYNARSGAHFYTASEAEKASVQANYPASLSYEGVAYTLDSASPDATHVLHRFYNVATGTHFYTASDAERDAVTARYGSVYRYEGEAFKVSPVPAPGAVPCYRFYNYRVGGVHFYTVSAEERDAVIARYGSTYQYEGIAYYAPTAPQAAVPAVETGDLAAAQAAIGRAIQNYPSLGGTTVEMGYAAGYEAIAYYTIGRIVISPGHTSSIDRIVAHEVWHVIDWRDNGVLDWGESVPPANASDYLGSTR